ncbi:MAG: hypothetical protein U0990_06445 [Candidatus Nanopelagicales bacterium]|nr:hypothetical protein [Candidatus Nanopelagicales bacterium]MDZ4249714.1 hypothetical protein [Candidatus Nanopelagicales bacterium]
MAETRSLRDAKRDAFVKVIDRLAGTTVSGRPLKARRNAGMLRLEVDLPDGSSGLIALPTIKDGLSTGEFEFDPAVLLYNGRIWNVLRQLPLWQWSHPPRDAVLSARPPRLRGRGFRVATPDAKAIGAEVNLVRSEWIPLLESFSGRWSGALDHTLARPHEVAAPFSTAIILAFLADQRDRLDEARASSQTSSAFWDAGEIPDVDKHINQIEALVALSI